jgi:hypothetical protein
MRIVLSLAAHVTGGRLGRERKARADRLEEILEPLLAASVPSILGARKYLHLLRNRTRAHVFFELGDRQRVCEPAMFPPHEEWCQLCSVEVEADAFLSLDLDQQVSSICDQVRTSVDAYLVADRGARPQEEVSPVWMISYSYDREQEGKALRQRHFIEESLDAELGRRGVGGVGGGSIGGGEMEIFIELEAPKRRSDVEPALYEVLRLLGFAEPDRITPV